MSAMEHSTVSQPPAADPLRTQTDGDTDERDLPHFRSLTMPGLAKGPILPVWLTKRFRRKDTPASS
jgi:hypothetical protein